MEVDPQFKRSGQRSQQRRMKRLIQRAILGVAFVVLLAGGLGWWIWGADPSPFPGDPDQIATSEDGSNPGEDQTLQMQTDTAAPPVRVPSAFVDIAGDPMILRFEGAGDQKSTDLPGPAALDAARFGSVTPKRLVLVRDEMVVNERQLITALPSSREDFAFFQAQRNQSLAEPTAPTVPTDTQGPAPDDAAGDLTQTDGSWGAALSGDEETAAADAFTETVIQNTTSITYVRPEAQRTPIFSDIVLKMEVPRGLAEVLTSNGFAEAPAKDLAEKAKTLVPALEKMTVGSILAIRIHPDAAAPEVLQLSLYGPDGYIGSIARIAPGQYASAADAWIDDDLPRLASKQDDTAQVAPGQEFRLLDAFYSAAIRNGVPTTLVGETIVLMSQAYDMEAIATPGDTMTLLFAPAPGNGGPGASQIAYAGIDGPSGKKACYVAPDADPSATAGTAFACFRPSTGGGGAAPKGGALAGGLITPTGGILTSTFGPRFHPILKVVRVHEGVDWAAPTGTPVFAVADGVIKLAGNGGGYGNVVYITHAGGVETRYAHFDRFAPAAKTGASVKAGDLIGYIGTTGRSTGPHLHFEVRLNGTPVDPFTFAGAGPTAVASSGGLGASAAVEVLTDRIIHVESGGSATAKNPLSSATGAGQFIESTWLRMMKDYRPDLSGNMARQALLDLRNDPTLSREMVMNLARENEAFLRGRGHQITAGRLYLAHFLGPAGASTVLASQDGQLIMDVMGAGVVGANPFLKAYTVADLKNWAERKMTGASGAAIPRIHAPVIIPEAVKVYMSLIDAMIAPNDPEGDQADGTKPDAPPE